MGSILFEKFERNGVRANRPAEVGGVLRFVTGNRAAAAVIKYCWGVYSEVFRAGFGRSRGFA